MDSIAFYFRHQQIGSRRQICDQEGLIEPDLLLVHDHRADRHLGPGLGVGEFQQRVGSALVAQVLLLDIDVAPDVLFQSPACLPPLSGIESDHNAIRD
jgi:hypothetical protein